MSEPAEPSQLPEAVPSPAPARAGHNWHRIRVYLLSILLMVTMWLGASLITIRLHPERVVDGLMAQLPFSYSRGSVFWVNRRTLEIDDVKVGGFFYADEIIITASPFGLLRHRIAKVQILGGKLFTTPLYAAMNRAGAGTGKGLDWVIGRLEISNGTVMLDNLVADTAIPVQLGVLDPIVLTGLRLGEPDSSPEMTEPRTIEIGAVNIFSPVDPISPVFEFPLTRIRFTYVELWHHHVRKIEMIQPTMYLGEDLFWLTKQFKSENSPKAAQGPGAPWEVARFEVDYGRLAVNAFGQPVVHFPFFFNTKVDNIRLDQLDQISAKSNIDIQRLDQDYPDYKVRIVNLSGKLYFSWPPTDANANNIVNTIHVDEVSWNGIPAKAVSTTVTFDPNGVYGKLYGTCEGGQLSGNFEFYYSKGFTWNADFFASKVSCQPIAQKVAGEYINLTGQLDGQIGVQGQATEILHCSGLLQLPNPGLLEIKTVDDLLQRIPADMITLKRDALKIVISAFRTYPYDSGQLKIDYKPTGGSGTLQLQGPLGKRQFDVYLHPSN
jgi:hypothetical protein